MIEHRRPHVAVVGAGLAGSECAWVLANHYGLQVTLFEMKSIQPTPAQTSPHLFAELVCSNSLKSKSLLNPAGTLKHEIAALGSLVVPSALSHEVPAGETLAVEREAFSQSITDRLRAHEKIQIETKIITHVEELTSSPDFDAIVIATGPLTEDRLARSLNQLTGRDELYFYDAIAPIIDGDTIDYDVLFRANRQSRTQAFEKARATGSGGNAAGDAVPEGLSRGATAAVAEEEQLEDEGDYLNIPLEKEPYLEFVRRVCELPKVPHREFEEPRYFNGCQPIEVLAERGPKTLAFGPMKPLGLVDPHTGRRPYAVVQLRKEDKNDFAWNMVGFQTRLTWGAQKELFRTLPGLGQAEFLRMGSMHRNTYLVSPALLNPDFSLKACPKMYLAGQIMGVEGYLESAAMGVYMAHVIGHRLVHKKECPLPPANTSLGALARYCLFSNPKNFTPMNIHWGLFEDLTPEDIRAFADEPEVLLQKKRLDKSTRRHLMSCRSQHLFKAYLQIFANHGA